MNDILQDAVTTSALVADGSHVLVAASGGADSMALLATLVSLRERMKLRVSAGHFDHGLRAESARDAELVADYCKRKDVELCVGAGDVAARAERHRETTEEAARVLRYAFLDETASRIGADLVATAHTRDDQIETILMQLARGAGVRGVAGIPSRRGRIVRPLLGVAGDETRAWCDRHNVPYSVDSTNTDTRISRNRVRHKVLPELKRLSPDIDERLLRLGERARSVLEDARSRTNPVLERARREASGAWIIACDDVHALDDDDRVVLFGDLLFERLHSTRELGRSHYTALLDLSRPDAQTGGRASLPGCEARREHDAIVFTPGCVERKAPVARVELKTPGVTRVGDYNVRVDFIEGPQLDCVDFTAAKSTGTASIDVAYFDRSSVGLPLVARTPLPGDRMRPFGMQRGRKKLSDIFVDKGVPHRRRAGTLVIADAKQILWAVGVATSESVRIEPPCDEIIRVTVTPFENRSKPGNNLSEDLYD